MLGNNQPFVQVAERKQQAMVQKALFERNHVYDVDCSVLYFSNHESVSMTMYFDTGFDMTTSQIRLLDMFCSNASVCLENVALSSRMHNLAFFDPLTGLSNRLHLLQTLSISLRSHKKYDSVRMMRSFTLRAFALSSTATFASPWGGLGTTSSSAFR